MRVYSYGIDEGSAVTVRAERTMWKSVHENRADIVVATLAASFRDLADFRLTLDAKRTAWIQQSLFQ